MSELVDLREELAKIADIVGTAVTKTEGNGYEDPTWLRRACVHRNRSHHSCR